MDPTRRTFLRAAGASLALPWARGADERGRPMDSEQLLLQALHEDPDDEMAWLALADCLEETGQPARAELLRLHRQLRGLPEGKDRTPLESRVQELLASGVRPCVPTFTNSIGMELALIPPGSFWIGSPEGEEGRYGDEGPRKCIRLTRPFYLGVYAVTQQEYAAIMVDNPTPSTFCATGSMRSKVAKLDTSRFPVEHIDWHDAVLFCRRLSLRAVERKAGRKYRLPTEVEWEYACRGGASLSSPFIWGATITREHANFRDNTPRKKHLGRPTPVGSYPANGFGLYDMVGNTWEWCADWYSGDAYRDAPECDPPGPSSGTRRNARGGTYNLEARRVRSADRSSFEPDYRDSDIGLRVLCEVRKRD